MGCCCNIVLDYFLDSSITQILYKISEKTEKYLLQVLSSRGNILFIVYVNILILLSNMTKGIENLPLKIHF